MRFRYNKPITFSINVENPMTMDRVEIKQYFILLLFSVRVKGRGIIVPCILNLGTTWIKWTDLCLGRLDPR